MLKQRLKRKIQHICLEPIRIFCFHQVSDNFDKSTMWECDWLKTDVFKKKIVSLSKQYSFISLPEAYQHIKNDFVRSNKYAVLTCDDGWQSIIEILPWIFERHIPVTLFLNPEYLLGLSTRENNMSGLFREEQIKELIDKFHDYLTIASHGWNHDNNSSMDIVDFQNNILKAERYLTGFNNKIPFYAYPYGSHTLKTDEILLKYSLIPVYCDGRVNYRSCNYICRELL